MLCVTMTIVTSSRSSAMVSSMRRVEVGSSAEPGPVDVEAVDRDGARQGRAGLELVHAVQDAEERGLATARWSDERGDLVRLHRQRDSFEHLVIAEPRADVARVETTDARQGF